MSRSFVLKNPAMPVAERRARIEGEGLPANIGTLLDAACAEAGEHVAWNFFEAGESITYAALRRQVNGLANGLLSRGVHKGTHVAVMLPNLPAMPKTWLALARLGAVMVPVNPAYTARELAYVVNDSNSEYLVMHQDALGVLEATMADRSIALPHERVIVVGEANIEGTQDGRTSLLKSGRNSSRRSRSKPMT